METSSSLPSVNLATRRSRPRPTFSCIRCAERKVKCDRQQPCNACFRHKVGCIYKMPPPPRRHRRRDQDPALIGRLKCYEALLRAKGIDPTQAISASKPDVQIEFGPEVEIASEEIRRSPLDESGSGREVSKTQVILSRERSQFVDNSLWTRIAEELQTPEELLESSFSDASDTEDFNEDLSFVLEPHTNFRLRSPHPPADRIIEMFEIFGRNVDPLTKIVHVPTLRTAMQRASSNVNSVPHSFEALMFAIYAAATMSLTDDECRERFQKPRETLFSQWLSASKAALARANFMSTNSLVVLQALILHLISVRHIYEPRTSWSLTAVALRIAQGMGLERDGTLLGLPPFDTEMRRRIWWLLKMYDYQLAELCGHAKFRDLDTSFEAPKWPSNVNDDQIYPGMSCPPVESKRLTDMAFIALRSEMTQFVSLFATRLSELGRTSSESDLNAAGEDKLHLSVAIKEMEDTVETKFLRYCDPSQPLHLMLMFMGRMSINIVHFRTNHPRRWASIDHTPAVERQQIWEASLKLLEQHSMVQTNPQLKNFVWHAKFFMPWHALIHVIDTLRAAPLTADAQRAWNIINDMYKNNPEIISETKRVIHVAVSKLCLKAYSARETALRSKQLDVGSVPDFIIQLRAHEKATEARSEGRRKKMRQSRAAVNRFETVGINHVEHQKSDFEQSSDAVEYDPFWFSHGLAGGQNDMMNLDLTYDHPGYDDQAITWDQWDKFLANYDVLQ